MTTWTGSGTDGGTDGTGPGTDGTDGTDRTGPGTDTRPGGPSGTGGTRPERRLFDVRDVPASVNDDARRTEGTRRFLGRRERDRVLPAVYYECRHANRLE